MTDDIEMPAEPTQTYPDGDYAVVEVLGHVRHIGRYQEVERFGQKFCEVEPIEDGEFKTPVLVGGSSIYQFRTCTAQYAFDNAPQSWEYRRARQTAALPAPKVHDSDFAEVDEDYDDGFPI